MQAMAAKVNLHSGNFETSGVPTDIVILFEHGYARLTLPCELPGGTQARRSCT